MYTYMQWFEILVNSMRIQYSIHFSFMCSFRYYFDIDIIAVHTFVCHATAIFSTKYLALMKNKNGITTYSTAFLK